MTVEDRLTRLHDLHTISGVLAQTPDSVVLSEDLRKQYLHDLFRGCTIQVINGNNVMIVGFKE